ncbi:MAG TPA: hypothetical protein PLO37_19255 [Candidatus Hydrogenedentes bacterium]|nr:hypothetical protein [Candidatus Hydrogenedentota bacterium]HPG68990.1 hypothetical protein [Candidatus Hydrogenedentota bacterium]
MTLREALAGRKQREIGTITFRGDLYRCMMLGHSGGSIVEFRFLLMPGKELPICARFKGEQDFWQVLQHVMKHNLLKEANFNITAMELPHFIHT